MTCPNTLNREHVQQWIVVFCKVHGRDLANVVADIKRFSTSIEDRLRKMPGNYHIGYSGQFEAHQQANFRLLVLGSVSILGVFLLLTKCINPGELLCRFWSKFRWRRLEVFIGLLPLLFGAGQTGKEILYPLALVVFGGMLTSTVLDQVVTPPALFFKFARNVVIGQN